MSNKYRVVENVNYEGDPIFIPQQKKFLFWFDFWNLDFPPSAVKFHSITSAKEFIQKQIIKPKNKIYYIN
jgi:hypothetical protein